MSNPPILMGYHRAKGQRVTSTFIVAGKIEWASPLLFASSLPYYYTDSKHIYGKPMLTLVLLGARQRRLCKRCGGPFRCFSENIIYIFLSFSFMHVCQTVSSSKLDFFNGYPGCFRIVLNFCRASPNNIKKYRKSFLRIFLIRSSYSEHSSKLQDLLLFHKLRN